MGAKSLWMRLLIFCLLRYAVALPSFAGARREEPKANSTTGNPPEKTLIPAVHWDHPGHDLDHLVPCKDSHLYYSHQGVRDPNVEHMFAKLKTTLHQDTVFLHHSRLIDRVSCDSGDEQISIKFINATAFSFAASSWALRSEFVVATYTPSCGTVQDQHTFWLIRNVVSDSTANTVTAYIEKELTLKDVVNEVDMEWGTYYPPAKKTQPDKSGTNGPIEAKQDNEDPTFDIRLDQAAGYYNFYGSDQRQQVLRFFPDVDFDHDSNLMKRSLLLKRDVWNPYQAVVTAIGAIGQVAAQDSGAGGKGVAGPQGVSALSNAFTLWSPSISKTFSLSIGPKKDTNTVWGMQHLLYAQPNIAIFCVNCGVIGTVTIEGRAKFGFGSQPQALNVKLSANLAAGVNLGMVANVAYSASYSKSLATFPGPGFSIPAIFSIGPFITLDAQLGFSFTAQGAALVGVTLQWPNFVASLDAVNLGSSGITGWQPTILKNAQFAGTIKADATLATPLTFGIGVQIPLIGFDKSIALVDRPSLHANVAYNGASCANGFSYSGDFTNDVLFNFIGKTYNLNHYQVSLFSGCQPSRRSLPMDPLYERNAAALPRRIVDRAAVSASRAPSPASTPQSSATSASPGSPSPPPASPTPTVGPSPTSGGPSSSIASPPGSYSPVIIASEEDPTFNPTYTQIPTYTGPIGDVDVDPNNTEIQYIASSAHNVASQGTNVEGVNFDSIIVGANRAYQVIVADDGNMYPTSPNTGAANGTALFGVYNGVAAINYQGLILHYYSDTMQQYNASRIRATDINDTATTSRFVGLKSMPYGGNPEMIYAVDTSNNAFYLTMCNYSNNQTSRIFITANSQGVTKLQDPALQNSITGGPVSSCVPVALTFSKASAGSSSSTAPSTVATAASPAKF